MARIYAIEEVIPVIDPTAFVHPEAVIIGDVFVGADCYIGPGASLRGDFGPIRIGAGSNIQDNCVLHSFPERTLSLAANSHVGHSAILHGCTLEYNAMIGMNAVIMDEAVIGESAFVAANAFVKTGAEVATRTLVAGSPARRVRELSDNEVAWKTRGTAEYQQLARRCHSSLTPTEALTEPEADRPKLKVSAEDATIMKHATASDNSVS